MEFGTLEILALILIVLVAIKVAVVSINQNAWFGFVEKIYVLPQLMSVIGLILAALVLYFIINSGISIIEILAVCLFIALLILTGMANYAEEIIAWARQQDLVVLMKRLWLYTVAWILLIAWGIQALFFDK